MLRIASLLIALSLGCGATASTVDNAPVAETEAELEEARGCAYEELVVCTSSGIRCCPETRGEMWGCTTDADCERKFGKEY